MSERIDIAKSAHNTITHLVRMYGELLVQQEQAHQMEMAIANTKIAQLTTELKISLEKNVRQSAPTGHE